MRTRALDQARLEWVINHRKTTHWLYELAARGDAHAASFKRSIYDRGHLTEHQLTAARSHIKHRMPGVDLDDSR